MSGGSPLHKPNGTDAKLLGAFRNSAPQSPSIPLHPRIRDVGEGDAHGCFVATLLHAAVVDHLAAVTGAQLVEGASRRWCFSVSAPAGPTMPGGVPVTVSALALAPPASWNNCGVWLPCSQRRVRTTPTFWIRQPGSGRPAECQSRSIRWMRVMVVSVSTVCASTDHDGPLTKPSCRVSEPVSR